MSRKGWRECKLKDIGENFAMGPFGSNIKAENFIKSGIPVIRGKNLNFPKYVDGEFVFISEEKADELKNSNCFPDDIIITHRGTLGQVCLISRKQYQRYIVSQSGMKFSVNPRKADCQFVFYYLKSNIGQHELLQHESQVGVPSISNPLTSLKSVNIFLPPLPEQKTIAAILSSLDDKIDLLHHQNKTLESLAETLFRQWFVEEADEQIPVSDCIDFNPQRVIPKGLAAPYLEMANVNTNTFHPIDWYDREFSSGMKFINRDTLLARITPCLENGKAAYVTFLEDGQTGWGSTEFIVLRPKGNIHPLFAYALAKNQDFRDYAEGCLEGSSGRQRVNVDHLMNFEINPLTKNRISGFNRFMEAIEPKLVNNFTGIRTLEQLRDTLLPRLMSGAVEIIF